MDRRTILIFLACAFAGCKGSSQPGGEGSSAPGSTSNQPATDTPAANPTPKTISLNGAGATFPYPLYSKWISEYNKANPNIRINYQSIGSGGGIRQVTAGTVDFGATDAPMNPDETRQAPQKILHIPATIGAVVISYNLPEMNAPLKLTPDTLAEIYLGKIKKWNDAKLVAANSGVKLPNKDISVVYRTDGSGTTAVFTEYLASVSPEWKEKVGAAKSVKWPVGLGAKGNEGVTGQLKTMPFTVGYIERAYASQSKLPMAEIRNQAGHFSLPSTESMSAAAAGVELPDTLYTSLVNSPAEKAYPITGYTYILVYEEVADASKGEAMAKYLWWALHEGQKFAQDLDYAPLPAATVSKIETRLKELRSGDKKFLSGM